MTERKGDCHGQRVLRDSKPAGIPENHSYLFVDPHFLQEKAEQLWGPRQVLRSRGEDLQRRTPRVSAPVQRFRGVRGIACRLSGVRFRRSKGRGFGGSMSLCHPVLRSCARHEKSRTRAFNEHAEALAINANESGTCADTRPIKPGVREVTTQL